MYNKLFTKILDSSIWLESDTTRIVWLTCIAAMDQDGFVQFASVANLAHRANVPIPAAESAVATLEGPDPNSSDPDHEGRRIERVPGGWVVLNAVKYRELVTRMAVREMTRLRVSRHREKRSRNAVKRNSNAAVTQSEAYTEAEADSVCVPRVRATAEAHRQTDYTKELGDRVRAFIEGYGVLYAKHRNGAHYHGRPSVDYQTACDLCRTWPETDRLLKLAAVFLASDDEWIAKGNRSIPQFAARASWCDDRLREWEKAQGRAS